MMTNQELLDLCDNALDESASVQITSEDLRRLGYFLLKSPKDPIVWIQVNHLRQMLSENDVISQQPAYGII
jgi:hypothetical protein